MKKGDIVLIEFPFTDLIDSKLRPAIILLVTRFDYVVWGWNQKAATVRY